MSEFKRMVNILRKYDLFMKSFTENVCFNAEHSVIYELGNTGGIQTRTIETIT